MLESAAASACMSGSNARPYLHEHSLSTVAHKQPAKPPQAETRRVKNVAQIKPIADHTSFGVALQCRSCPNLAELVKKANSSSSGASASSSSGNSSSSSTSNRRAGRVKRQVSCSALLVPVDIPVVDMWDTARQSITHELHVESALHVSAVQRFECLQRHYSGSADDSVATAMLTAPDVAHHSSSLVTITAAAAVPEVAACYATPSEGVEQLRNAAEELANWERGKGGVSSCFNHTEVSGCHPAIHADVTIITQPFPIVVSLKPQLQTRLELHQSSSDCQISSCPGAQLW